MKRRLLLLLTLFSAVYLSAQTEQETRAVGSLGTASPYVEPHRSADTTGLPLAPVPFALSSSDDSFERAPRFPLLDNDLSSMRLIGPFALSARQTHAVGLMDTSTGTLSFTRDLSHFHFTAMATAHQYWMPFQSQLYTQYGLGATASLDISPAVALHAYGYYYASNPMVGPALSPYVMTSSFGTYAGIAFNDYWGVDVGVRRYVNPMTGRWTTEPIFDPYVKLGRKTKLGIGLGHLLKAAIWGSDDHPLRYAPPPRPKQK